MPRALVTPHLVGRTIGPVGDRARQREVVLAAPGLFADADGPATRVDLQTCCTAEQMVAFAGRLPSRGSWA